jgi:hypothetical protein
MDYRNCDKLALLTGHDWRPMYPDEISHGFHPGETLCAISPYRGWLHPDGNQPFYIPAQHAPIADPEFFVEHFVNRKYGLANVLPSIRFELEGDIFSLQPMIGTDFIISGEVSLSGSLTFTNLHSIMKNTKISLEAHSISFQAKEVAGNIVNELSISGASQQPPQIDISSSVLGTTWRCQADWKLPEITATVSTQIINAQVDDWLIEGELGGKFTGRATPRNPASAAVSEVSKAVENMIHGSEQRTLALRELIQFNIANSWSEVTGGADASPSIKATLPLWVIGASPALLLI